MNKCGEIKVTKQVKVPFTIGKYKDEVVCDVVLMHCRHLLLGCPWQYDGKVVHDDYTNQYSFVMNGKPIPFVPLSPWQVYKDQLHLQPKSEETKKNSLRTEGEQERVKEK